MILLDKKYYLLLFFALILSLISCKKSTVVPPVDPVPPVVIIETPNEVPDLSFGAWIPKTITLPASYDDVLQSTSSKTVDIDVNFSKRVTKVSKYVYGNNANCFTGWMQNDAVLMQKIDQLKRIETFEDWSMGNDQYYQMMQTTGTTGMVTVNYGYARYGTSTNPVAQAAHLAADWVRNDNGRSKFWEIGNEVFGSWEAGYEIDQTLNKDGQPKIITGDLYGKHALVFIDSMKQAALQIGKEIFIGVVLLEESGSGMANWNKEVIARVGGKVDFYIVHSYFTPYKINSAPDVILSSPSKIAGYKTYVQNELLAQSKPVVPVFLTEWNIFSEGSKQQVSFVDGMHASLVLGELIKNKFEMASRWDLANGWADGNDHGLFSYGDEPGVAKYAARPAFYYLYYFQKYFGDVMVEATSVNNSVVAYASQFSSGEAGIVIVNKNSIDQVVELNLKNFKTGGRYYTYTLTGGTDNGFFSRKVYVNGLTTLTEGGGPENYESIKPKSTIINGNIKLNLPKYAIVHLLVEKKL